MTALLQAEDLVVTRRHVTVLDRVGVTLQRGRLLALVGPNGAGKSTLLSVLAGLLKPHSGRVLLEGCAIDELPGHELARRVASLGQAELPDDELTALEVVLLGRAPHLGAWGLPGDDDVTAARAAMAITDVTHLEARRVGTLSGGERQRVLVARALCQGGDALLLDEPTASLDVGHELHVLRALREEARAGRGVIVALHDLALAARHADDVVLLHRGRLVAAGPWRDVLTPTALQQCFGVSMRVQELDGQPVLLVDAAPAGGA